jgi:hypothetical protein
MICALLRYKIDDFRLFVIQLSGGYIVHFVIKDLKQNGPWLATIKVFKKLLWRKQCSAIIICKKINLQNNLTRNYTSIVYFCTSHNGLMITYIICKCILNLNKYKAAVPCKLSVGFWKKKTENCQIHYWYRKVNNMKQFRIVLQNFALI